MIDLTLNAFLHPDIVGLKPLFGSVIERTTANKGGLSTIQTDTNVSMMFSLMRPIEVAASDETSTVEFDAKILLTGTNPLTITLANAAYNGCRVVVMNGCTVQASITSGKINGQEQGVVPLPVNGVLSLTFFKDTWYADSVETTLDKKIQKQLSATALVIPVGEPTAKVTGSIWIET